MKGRERDLEQEPMWVASIYEGGKREIRTPMDTSTSHGDNGTD